MSTHMRMLGGNASASPCLALVFRIRLTINSLKVTDGPNGARGGSFYHMSEFGDLASYRITRGASD